MKKQLLNMLAVSLFIGIAIAMVISCSKTENEYSPQNGERYQLNEFIPAQEEIIPLINLFNSKYQEYKLGYKSGEVIPLNEAIWNLEAVVNYEYCEPDENINDPNSTTYSIIVELSEGTNGDYFVSVVDLMTAFDVVKMYTENELTSDSGIFIVADVELTTINDLEADLKLVVTSGHPHLPACEILENDYWYFANGLGKCDIYSNTGIGHDASTRINYILNCVEYSCPGGTVFFTNVTTYLDVPTGSADYLNTCCDPEYMDWILNEAWYTINYYQPSGKVYIDCEYSCDIILGTLWGHIFDELQYGVYNCKPLETK